MVIETLIQASYAQLAPSSSYSRSDAEDNWAEIWLNNKPVSLDINSVERRNIDIMTKLLQHVLM